MFCVFLGSGFGGMLRFMISLLSRNIISDKVYIATLIINLTACFFLGFCAEKFSSVFALHHDYKLFALVGFAGGFSTFSTFSFEVLTLIDKQDYLSAALYLMLSLILGIGLIFLGQRLAV